MLSREKSTKTADSYLGDSMNLVYVDRKSDRDSEHACRSAGGAVFDVY
jgi:hypothetical protein